MYKIELNSKGYVETNGKPFVEKDGMVYFYVDQKDSTESKTVLIIPISNISYIQLIENQNESL